MFDFKRPAEGMLQTDPESPELLMARGDGPAASCSAVLCQGYAYCTYLPYLVGSTIVVLGL